MDIGTAYCVQAQRLDPADEIRLAALTDSLADHVRQGAFRTLGVCRTGHNPSNLIDIIMA
ncbi:hypothetical protein [Gluconobacter morbifer]|uniref:Uncharacterized protein n=1 Tax=Gluconobacter morbifer G707 TaxID=1088869 RepID=G6XK75_9PROT|nr:hypothetical protein [Gluconobacter morbifer]EHH67671.1 hypothetical protein GMO_18910 [Gluconobacter morbifer G707]